MKTSVGRDIVAGMIYNRATKDGAKLSYAARFEFVDKRYWL